MSKSLNVKSMAASMAPTKSMAATSMAPTKAVASAAMLSPPSIAPDQCFDWMIGVPEGVRKKDIFKFPVDFRKIKEQEAKKRQEHKGAAKRTKDQEKGKALAQPEKANKVTIVIVGAVIFVLAVISIGVFVHLVLLTKKDKEEDF